MTDPQLEYASDLLECSHRVAPASVNSWGHGRRPQGGACMADAIPMPETWRPVVGWEGLYEVSDQGRVRRVTLGALSRIRVPQLSSWRHYTVQLWRGDGRPRRRTIHSLVLEAFVCRRPEGCEGNHKNGNKLDNRLENLEWVTPSGNAFHAFQTGLRRSPRGDKAGPGRFTAEQIAEIRSLSEPNPVIAERYGLSRSYVWRIRNGRVRTDG